jgi:hypothetical protein
MHSCNPSRTPHRTADGDTQGNLPQLSSPPAQLHLLWRRGASMDRNLTCGHTPLHHAHTHSSAHT